MFQQHPHPFPGDCTKLCQEGNCALFIFILRAQHKAWNTVGVTLKHPQQRLALVCDVLGHFFRNVFSFGISVSDDKSSTLRRGSIFRNCGAFAAWMASKVKGRWSNNALKPFLVKRARKQFNAQACEWGSPKGGGHVDVCKPPEPSEHSWAVNRFTDRRWGQNCLTVWPALGGFKVTVVEHSNSFIFKNQWISCHSVICMWYIFPLKKKKREMAGAPGWLSW